MEWNRVYDNGMSGELQSRMGWSHDIPVGLVCTPDVVYPAFHWESTPPPDPYLVYPHFSRLSSGFTVEAGQSDGQGGGLAGRQIGGMLRRWWGEFTESVYTFIRVSGGNSN